MARMGRISGYCVAASIFSLGYFRVYSTLNHLIRVALIEGDDIFYYLRYGRKGLLYIVLSFIWISAIYFTSEIKWGDKN